MYSIRPSPEGNPEMYINPEDGTFTVPVGGRVEINGFLSIYWATDEGQFLVPAAIGGKIVFVQEYMLPLHLLERRDGALHLRIQQGGIEMIEVPDWAVKLVVWDGRCYFASARKRVPVAFYGYQILPLPEGTKPEKDLPPLM